jgi:hypothetical protein
MIEIISILTHWFIVMSGCVSVSSYGVVMAAVTRVHDFWWKFHYVNHYVNCWTAVHVSIRTRVNVRLQ